MGGRSPRATAAAALNGETAARPPQAETESEDSRPGLPDRRTGLTQLRTACIPLYQAEKQRQRIRGDDGCVTQQGWPCVILCPPHRVVGALWAVFRSAAPSISMLMRFSVRGLLHLAC